VLEILRVRFGVYHQHGIAALFCGARSRSVMRKTVMALALRFAPGDVDTQLMHDTFAALLPPPPAATGAMRE